MCMPKSPSVPKPPAPVEPKAAPKRVDASVQAARTDEKNQARVSSGRRGTILTGGLLKNEEANTGRKTLLGQ